MATRERIELRGDPAAGPVEVRLGGRPQSWVDLRRPTEVGFDYLRRLADVLDLAAPPGERLAVVHVGGAAMTLARYVAAVRPTSRQVVLEPDAELVAVVRRELPLPPRSGIKVREIDGATGLAAMPDGYAEVVVVDAFEDGEVPADLLTPVALADLRRVASPSGLVALNLVDQSPFPLVRAVVGTLSAPGEELVLGADAATWRGRGSGNVVVVAGSVGRLASLTPALRDRAVRTATPYRWLAGAEVRDRFG